MERMTRYGPHHNSGPPGVRMVSCCAAVFTSSTAKEVAAARTRLKETILDGRKNFTGIAFLGSGVAGEVVVLAQVNRILIAPRMTRSQSQDPS